MKDWVANLQSYKPITESLKELLTSLKPNIAALKFKTEVKEKEPFIDRKEYYKTIPYGKLNDNSLITVPYMESSSFKLYHGKSFFDESIYHQKLSTVEHENERRFQEYLENYASLFLRAFIANMIRSNGKEFDDKFGIYFVPHKETWAIGNSKLKFDEQDVLLGNEMLCYKDTPGLYELLFKKILLLTDLKKIIDSKRMHRRRVPCCH